MLHFIFEFKADMLRRQSRRLDVVKAPTKSMVWKSVKMIEDTGIVDVLGRVTRCTTVAEDLVAVDTDGLTASNTESAYGNSAAVIVKKRPHNVKIFPAK